MRYSYIASVPGREERLILRKLAEAGILPGLGRDESGQTVVDLSPDMVRMLILLYNSGVFDSMLLYRGLTPALQ